MLGTLRAQQDSARQAVYDWNADQLLAMAEADVIEYVPAEYSIPCPVLHRDQIERYDFILHANDDPNRKPGWRSCPLRSGTHTTRRERCSYTNTPSRSTRPAPWDVFCAWRDAASLAADQCRGAPDRRLFALVDRANRLVFCPHIRWLCRTAAVSRRPLRWQPKDDERVRDRAETDPAGCRQRAPGAIRRSSMLRGSGTG